METKDSTFHLEPHGQQNVAGAIFVDHSNRPFLFSRSGVVPFIWSGYFRDRPTAEVFIFWNVMCLIVMMGQAFTQLL